MLSSVYFKAPKKPTNPLVKMGKNKNSSAKRQKTVTKTAAGSLPSFDENALSALTDRIDKSLDKSKVPADAVNWNDKQHKNSSSADASVVSKSKKTKGLENGRGTKRDAQGNAKVVDTKQKKNAGGKVDPSMLLKEILALDGNEEDLDLIKDAASEDEDEGQDSKTTDKSLLKEIAKFAASLGIEGQAEGDASEIEEDDEEDVPEAEWEEASEQDSETEADAPALISVSKPAKAALPVPKTSGASSSKDVNRLVSTSDWEECEL